MKLYFGVEKEGGDNEDGKTPLASWVGLIYTHMQVLLFQCTTYKLLIIFICFLHNFD
jgi:hypothetical protein